MWEINLDRADRSSLIEMFGQLVRDQLSDAAAEIERLNEALAKLEERSVELEYQVEEERKRYSKSLDVLRAAEERLSIVSSKRNQNSLSFDRVSTAMHENGQERRKLRFNLDKLDVKLAAALRWQSDESWARANADILLSMLEHIDHTHPIRIHPDGDRISWKTQEIYINDGFGGKFPDSFGSYWVQVVRTISPNGISQVQVLCKLDPDKPSSSGFHGYPHPHISGERPCLGNAAELISRAMEEKDFIAVIVVMTEFLTTYNYSNPYTKLAAIGIPNRWESPMCETGQHLMVQCDCHRCPSCGQIRQPHQLSDCGVCTSCCIKKHFYDQTAHQQRSGINGTGCTYRAVPRSQYYIEETKHEGDRQEDAQVHEDGVGQDVGDDAEVQG